MSQTCWWRWKLKNGHKTNVLFDTRLFRASSSRRDNWWVSTMRIKRMFRKKKKKRIHLNQSGEGSKTTKATKMANLKRKKHLCNLKRKRTPGQHCHRKSLTDSAVLDFVFVHIVGSLLWSPAASILRYHRLRLLISLFVWFLRFWKRFQEFFSFRIWQSGFVWLFGRKATTTNVILFPHCKEKVPRIASTLGYISNWTQSVVFVLNKDKVFGHCSSTALVLDCVNLECAHSHCFSHAIMYRYTRGDDHSFRLQIRRATDCIYH